MKKTHSSHLIFILLGLLLLLFMFVFGIQYFRSNYNFKPLENILGSEDYEEGVSLNNPFFANNKAHNDLDIRFEWISFKSEALTFQYPDIFSLKIYDSTHIQILPPYINTLDNCKDIVDEQEKSLCMKPIYSPDITVQHTDTTNPQLASLGEMGREVINNTDWVKKEYQDEYGGQIWYISENAGMNTIVSYSYTDIEGGRDFNTLNEEYRNHYMLPVADQDKLALNIISTLRLK